MHHTTVESIGRLEACPETKSMLLEDFMKGFIFQLFMDKYHKFARYVHFAYCLISSLYVFSIIRIAFHKDTWDDPPTGWIIILYVTMFVIQFEEVRETFLWWKNEHTSGDLPYKAKRLFRYLLASNLPLKILGRVCALTGAGYLLNHRGDPSWDYETSTLTSSVSILMCVALLTSALVLIRDVLTSFRGLGVFVKIVNKMLIRDVATWMLLFGLYVVMFALALQLVMPKQYGTVEVDGEEITLGSFDRFLSLILLIYLLVTTGDGGDLLGKIYDLGNPWNVGLTQMSLVIYVVLIVFTIILLLNLLIAMSASPSLRTQALGVSAMLLILTSTLGNSCWQWGTHTSRHSRTQHWSGGSIWRGSCCAWSSSARAGWTHERGSLRITPRRLGTHITTISFAR